MRVRTIHIDNIPEDLDYPFDFGSENGVSGILDVFGVVIDAAVEGSVPIPNRADRYLIGYSNFCTHMGCRLAKSGAKLRRDPATGGLLCGPCPCHGTNFNLSQRGIVIIGPASQHLPQLILTVSDDNVAISGSFPTGNEDPVEESWPEDRI